MELKSLLDNIERTPMGPDIAADARSLTVALIGVIRSESDEPVDDPSVIHRIQLALNHPSFRDRLIRQALYGAPDGARERLVDVLVSLGLTATPVGDAGDLEYEQPDPFVARFAVATSCLQRAILDLSTQA